MFQATEREAFILRTLAGSLSIEETELLKILSEKETHTAQTFKNALAGCIQKEFVQKSEHEGKIFLNITASGKKQI